MLRKSSNNYYSSSISSAISLANRPVIGEIWDVLNLIAFNRALFVVIAFPIFLFFHTKSGIEKYNEIVSEYFPDQRLMMSLYVEDLDTRKYCAAIFDPRTNKVLHESKESNCAGVNLMAATQLHLDNPKTSSAKRHYDQIIVGCMVALVISIMATLMFMPMEKLSSTRCKFIAMAMFMLTSTPLVYVFYGSESINIFSTGDKRYITSTVMVNLDKGVEMTISPSWFNSRTKPIATNKIIE